MDIFATYATDETRENEGAIVFLQGDDLAKDPWIKVARMHNTAFQKAFTKAHEKLQMERKQLRLSDEEVSIRSENNMTELMAQTILKDFGNLSYQGKPITSTYETRLMMLRIKDFREMVGQKSMDFDLYRVEYKAEASGN